MAEDSDGLDGDLDADPLCGDLVRLRAVEVEDDPLLHRWINDAEVTRHLQARYPYSHAAERAYIEAVTANSYAGIHFIIHRLEDGLAIGSVHLARTSPENRSAVLGIIPAWRAGEEPFAAQWLDWRPDPAWEPPALPSQWDVLR